MYRRDGTIRLTVADLVRHLACRHLTELNLREAQGELDTPDRLSSSLDHLHDHALEHEHAYLEHLEASGSQVVKIGDRDRVAATREAMAEGTEIIYDALLRDGRWEGRPDILRRVERPSRFGKWSYEVVHAKLGREAKTRTTLRLCLYSQLLADAQEVAPVYMHDVGPAPGFELQRFRVQDYDAYVRGVRDDLEAALSDGARAPTYPDWKPYCGVCRWSSRCDDRRHVDDHPSIVAGISCREVNELSEHDIATVRSLARTPLPIPWEPTHGARATYERVREQARVQITSRDQGKQIYEPLPTEPQAGLSALPEPSDGDIFIDFRGAPLAGESGLEYLIGYATIVAPGELNYTPLWALDDEEEQRKFEQFVDFVMEQWRRYPDLHVFHYAGYEPDAMKRLAGRYGTREHEVDRMLSAGLFIDLYRVVRLGLLISAEGYAMTDLEEFTGYERRITAAHADQARNAVTASLDDGVWATVDEEAYDVVEGYSRENCSAMYHLREWLENIREELILGGKPLSRPEVRDDASLSWTAKSKANNLASDVPSDMRERNAEQQVRWLLANVLDFHQREGTASEWEFLRLHESTPEELFDARSAFVGLEYDGTTRNSQGRILHRYRMPQQEVSTRGGERLFVPGNKTKSVGTLEYVEPAGTAIEIHKSAAAPSALPDALIARQTVSTDVLERSLRRLDQDVAQNGLGGTMANIAAADLLLRNPPRAGGASLRRDNEDMLDAATRIVRRDNFGVLPIQGPPGTGKTYTAGRMIASVVKQGRRVGITAHSHQVIVNLLKDAYKAADELHVDLDAVRMGSELRGSEGTDRRTFLTRSYGEFFGALDAGRDIAAGTAWLWARDEARRCVDVLFVDEAAQMSLANVLAVSHAAPNLVLLGDPQQLEQPLQGTHPDGAAVSALGHLIGDRETILDSQGLFLEETWRLHPDICKFTSELFYGGRLKPRPNLEQQRIVSSSRLSGSGLRYLPVPHTGNQRSADEEVRAIAGVVSELLASGAHWIDERGEERDLKLTDILIIAPYNAQVYRIQDALPDRARVGTVDRFQGQEAPIVIYSMSTSTPADAPRGMDFLYSLNRLNVATSRARCLCLLVGSPALFQPECRSPQQMRLANAFCRYLELAEEIAL